MEAQTDANTSSSKKKKVAATAAVITAGLILALAGTFAWSSTQDARNDLSDTYEEPNYGGRLHDDFVYTSTDASTAVDGEIKTFANTFHDKDIYVENYLNDTNVYARVKLYEYMEIGPDAGESTSTATSVISGADIDDETTWAPHKYGESNPFQRYFKWTQEGQATYMPTFNMNNKSPDADIRGTKTNNYNEYIKFVDYSTTNVESFLPNTDANSQSDYEVTDTGISATPQTHHAKLTDNSDGVMSIAEWEATGSAPGKYWVYDTDGWAYWAEPIEHNSATGLLLNDVVLTGNPKADWYYGIYAKAEIVDASMWASGAENDTGYQFDKNIATTEMTDKAYRMMNIVAGIERPTSYYVDVSLAGGAETVQTGTTIQANATITGPDGQALSNPGIVWSIEPTNANVTINNSGVITVASDAIDGTEITVTAAYSANPEISDFTKFNVSAKLKGVDALKTMNVSTTADDVVEIDDIDWYKLAESNGQALIWAAKPLKNSDGSVYTSAFGSSQVWQDSTVRSYLNGDFINNNLTELKAAGIVKTDITTRSAYNTTNHLTTSDSVFLLSEADLFGSFNGDTTQVMTADYTVNGLKVADALKGYTGNSYAYWLRSPRSAALSNDCVAVVKSSGDLYTFGYGAAPGVLRPAMWVDLSKI